MHVLFPLGHLYSLVLYLVPTHTWANTCTLSIGTSLFLYLVPTHIWANICTLKYAIKSHSFQLTPLSQVTSWNFLRNIQGFAANETFCEKMQNRCKSLWKYFREKKSAKTISTARINCAKKCRILCSDSSIFEVLICLINNFFEFDEENLISLAF